MTEYFIAIKTHYPTTTVNLKQPLPFARNIQLIGVNGISDTHLVFCDLVEPNHSINNVYEEKPREAKLTPSGLIAVFPSVKYPSLKIREGIFPINHFSVTLLNDSGKGYYFRTPVIISLRVTS